MARPMAAFLNSGRSNITGIVDMTGR